MAKTSSVNRNEKRQRMASRDKGKRAQLKSVVMDRALPVEERFDASLKLDRRSFGWRLRVEERAARVALQRPVLGWARWDWWRLGTEGERPWGLVSLALGMYGVVGWALLLGGFVAPIAAFLGVGPPRSWMEPNRAPAAALAGAPMPRSEYSSQ